MHSPVDSQPPATMPEDELPRLETLIDRAALDELCKSFVALFGIAARIISADGTLIADAPSEQSLCRYLQEQPTGRRDCERTVACAKSTVPGPEGQTVPCFSGMRYRIFPIEYDMRVVGRLVLGPYAGSRDGVPPSLFELDARYDRAELENRFVKVPRAKSETTERLAKHLTSVLDLIFFSGHKAYLTSQMHLASVRESFRELSDKNHKLQQTYDRLRELDRLKSNFLATVSHELRTPLTSIIGYSEMLAEGLAGDLSDEQREFVRTIHGKGEQLLSLIVGLLDLSKLESGTISLRRRVIELGPILDEVVSTLAPSARKKDVALILEKGPSKIEIRGDPERIRQVFINLTDNAIKFSPRGGMVRLEVEPWIEEDLGDEEEGLALLAGGQVPGVMVRVRDSGIGIPERERKKVFDAFYQVDSSSTREHGGTGLGLAIVKRLVEAHGGTVHIESGDPEGAVFVVRLPPPTGATSEKTSVPVPAM